MRQETHNLIAGHETPAYTVNRYQVRHRPAIDGDSYPFAGLHFAEYAGDLVAQLALGNRPHVAIVADLLQPRGCGPRRGYDRLQAVQRSGVVVGDLAVGALVETAALL